MFNFQMFKNFPVTFVFPNLGGFYYGQWNDAFNQLF